MVAKTIEAIVTRQRGQVGIRKRSKKSLYVHEGLCALYHKLSPAMLQLYGALLQITTARWSIELVREG